MKRFPHVLILIAALLTMSGVAHAKAKGPQETLQQIDKDLRPLLKNAKANEKAVLNIVRSMLDFKTICEKSLGKHWADKDQKQRTKFSDTLQALIEKNVVARLKDTKDHIITYEGEELNEKKDKATVITVVADGTGPRAIKTEITYKMKKKGGKWVAVDMLTDGVSLVANYRAQFKNLIEENGWDGMIKIMEDKLAE